MAWQSQGNCKVLRLLQLQQVTSECKYHLLEIRFWKGSTLVHCYLLLREGYVRFSMVLCFLAEGVFMSYGMLANTVSQCLGKKRVPQFRLEKFPELTAYIHMLIKANPYVARF